MNSNSSLISQFLNNQSMVGIATNGYVVRFCGQPRHMEIVVNHTFFNPVIYMYQIVDYLELVVDGQYILLGPNNYGFLYYMLINILTHIKNENILMIDLVDWYVWLRAYLFQNNISDQHVNNFCEYIAEVIDQHASMFDNLNVSEGYRILYYYIYSCCLYQYSIDKSHVIADLDNEYIEELCNYIEETCLEEVEVRLHIENGDYSNGHVEIVYKYLDESDSDDSDSSDNNVNYNNCDHDISTEDELSHSFSDCE